MVEAVCLLYCQPKGRHRKIDSHAKPEVKEGKLSQDLSARTDVVYQSAEEENKTKIPVWLKFSDEGIPAFTTIDWANLIDEYSMRDSVGRIVGGESGIKGTPEQQAAVARLMHVCGVLCEMMYGTPYSGGWGWSGLANEAPDNGGYYRINSLLPHQLAAAHQPRHRRRRGERRIPVDAVVLHRPLSQRPRAGCWPGRDGDNP